MLGIFVVFFYFGIVGRYVTEPFNRNSPATCSECSNSQEISESSDLLLSQRDKRQYKYYLKDRTNAANVSIRHTREKMKSDTQYF